MGASDASESVLRDSTRRRLNSCVVSPRNDEGCFRAGRSCARMTPVTESNAMLKNTCTMWGV
jgi:hypothetical protein